VSRYGPLTGVRSPERPPVTYRPGRKLAAQRRRVRNRTVILPSAPDDAQYLTLAANGVLTDYRILDVGSMLLAIDGGPAGNYSLNVDPTAIDHGDLAQLATGNPHTQYMLGTILSSDGAILVRAGGVPDELPPGADTEVLTMVAGAPAWAAPAAGYGLLDSQPAELTIVNTSALTTLYTFAIPAATLVIGDILRLKLGLDYFNNSGASRTAELKVTLQGTVIFDDTSTNRVANAQRRPWPLQLDFYFRNASPNTRMLGILQQGSTTVPATGFGALVANEFNSTMGGDIDTTLANAATLLVEFKHSTNNASLEVRRRGATLELIHA